MRHQIETLEAIVFVTGFPPAADRSRMAVSQVAAAAAHLGYQEIVRPLQH